MAELLLGPLLRYVGETDAVVWAETDGPCEVSVLGTSGRTFCVYGHHYALLHVDGLERGTEYTYEVHLDGERVWPDPASELPPSGFHTLPAADPLRIAFGSCRVAAPHDPPWTLTKDEDDRGREIDALRLLALRMAERPRREWPDLLLLLGDQVYADEISPAAASFAESRRDTDRAARGAGARLRGVRASLPRELGRADHQVAALDGALGHDLRRPRRPRRLEHLRRLDRGDVRDRLVGGAPGGGDDVLLGLPAPREPQPRGAEPPRAARPDPRRRGRRGGAARVRGGLGSRDGRLALELLPRHRRHPRGGHRFARGPGAGGGPPHHGRRRGVEVDRAARHRRLRPPADRHVAAVPAGPRHAQRGGVERSRGRRGLGPCARHAWRSARGGASTSSTGPPSRTRSTRWPTCSAPSAPASAGTRRPRSSRCPATSTTPTCSRSGFHAGRACAARSGRRSAPPTAIHSTPRSGG